MKKLKILITGANGQLGQSLMHLTGHSDQIEWIPTDYQELDITDRQEVWRYTDVLLPDFIINCAAYTAVDQAELEYEKALKINSHGPENLALAAKHIDIPLIHISTDYVFSGQAWQPYLETDIPNPLSAYGRSKLNGEQALQKVGGKVIILRTSWLYSEFGKNFFLTMLRLGKEKESIGVIADQIGSPTYAGDLATGIIKLIEYHNTNPDWISEPEIFHFSNTGVASWYDLSIAIMEIAGLPCQVKPLRTEEYPLPAPRPAYSILNTKKFKDFFRLEIPYWRTSVNCCYKNHKDLNRQLKL